MGRIAASSGTPETYVLYHSYALSGRRLPLRITLDKLRNRGGVAQW